MKILADASLPGLQSIFKPPFQLTLYQDAHEIPSRIVSQEVLLCRSTLKVTPSLLEGSAIRIVATASSGTDHIDEAYLKANDIQLLDAKGSNATSVADYVLSCVAYLQQYQKLSFFQVAVIGMGAVGQQVALRLKKAGFNIVSYDPPRAIRDSDFHSATFNDVMQCDLICIHANLHTVLPFPSKNLINKQIFQQLKKNTIIINTSRGGIVNEADLLHGHSNVVYCTDVYIDEPNVNPDVIAYATLCTPHIAGHSVEAKHQAVIQVAQNLYARVKIPFVVSAEMFSSKTPFVLCDHWQETVLSLYNPWIETQLLKQAPDKKKAFLALRQAHQSRHNF